MEKLAVGLTIVTILPMIVVAIASKILFQRKEGRSND